MISPLPALLQQQLTQCWPLFTLQVFTGNSYAIDGCATFFRRDRFQLVKKYEVRGTLCLQDDLLRARTELP